MKCMIVTVKIKIMNRTSAVPPRSSSFPSLSVIIIYLFSLLTTCYYVNINSAEKLESFFEAMITHVAEKDIFSALIKP